MILADIFDDRKTETFHISTNTIMQQKGCRKEYKILTFWQPAVAEPMAGKGFEHEKIVWIFWCIISAAFCKFWILSNLQFTCIAASFGKCFGSSTIGFTNVSTEQQCEERLLRFLFS